MLNAFMADRRDLTCLQPPTDLFGTPLFLQQAIDAGLPFGRDTPSGFGVSPGYGEAMGFLRAMAPPPMIPPHLAADRGGVESNHTGNLGVPVSGFHQGLDLIT